MDEIYVRVGIDVGGTHTKAVAINEATGEIVGKASVKTTHDDKLGVAKGVVEAFNKCLKENNIDPSKVSFVAHSTTQATNALIEGDVAKVGVIGLGKGKIEGLFVSKQTKLKDIVLDKDSNKRITVEHDYIDVNSITDDMIAEKLNKFKNNGVDVVVASKAFGVDEDFFEEVISQKALEFEMYETMASSITKLYGLTRRTRTAVINASILPKMLKTADDTEQSVRKAHVKVPLMIMRGDGGVMEINEMKKRPVLTMLSGPAASVMGSLMYLRASNGIYFEVGGTTTNMGVIKNGRPQIDYSEVGGYKTHIASLDVKVLGVAGGSMVRANKKGIIDVGPRSAHIAGLDYSAFTDPKIIEDGRIEFFSPKKGDPSDYVKIVLKDKEITITNTCAANALKLVNEEHFSYGNYDAAYKAIKILADYVGKSVVEIATEILDKSYQKIEPVINGLIEKYQLEKDQISLVGVGGGASSLIIYVAQKMNLNYSIPKNAEVISSIGVAMSMIRDVVERVVPSPTKEDIKKIKKEAINRAILSGAKEDSIEVHVEIDSQTSKIRAIASGSTEVKTKDSLQNISEKEALVIAAKDLKCEEKDVRLLTKTSYFYVFGKDSTIRVIDQKGFIRVQKGKAECVKTNAKSYIEYVRKLWDQKAQYKSELIERPEFYLCFGAKVMDFFAMDLSKVEILMDLEMSLLSEDDEVILIAANR